MQKAYFKATFAAIDMVGLVKLQSLVGDFTIEGHDYHSAQNDVLIISFFTDKVRFEEGENRMVDVLFKKNENGDIILCNIIKLK